MANELAACGGCAFTALGVLLLFSFSSIAPTEMALSYNWVLKSINKQPMTEPGIVFLGPFNTLIRYPKTIQTMEYNQVHRDLLDGRTRDGLPLILGIAFQYRLLPDGLYHLYHTYETDIGKYEKIFQLMGMHHITEQATRFTAYQFFNEKQKIAEEMRRELDNHFQKHLFATVESFQINEDDLPAAFTETILHAANCKQNITRMEKTKDAKIVQFQTARQVAEAQANVTIAQAHGQLHRILQNGRADASIIDAYVQAELQAYGKVHDDLGLRGDSLINYIWYDMLGGGGVAKNGGDQDMSLLIGVNPSAYISEGAKR